jgi:chromosome transmission fidelity protein 1
MNFFLMFRFEHSIEGKKMEYGFPFPPYDIQKEFMKSVHDALDAGGIALLESPTGTGKTLSLICGTLSWFKKHAFALPLDENAGNGKTTEDPLQAHLEKIQREELEADQDAHAEHRNKVAKYVTRAHLSVGGHAAKPKSVKKTKVDPEDEFLLPDVHVVSSIKKEDEEKNGGSILSDPATTMRIFYTSRTHSQLHQFCEELRKTGFYCKKPSVMAKADMFANPQIWTASLGSRAGLCVYEPVRSLGSQTAVNDACQQKRESKGGCECNKSEAVNLLAAECLTEGLIDVEELFKRGQRRGTCAYFASRVMMKQCDLIVLPYQMLLHEPTRIALGLQTKGAVVIIDEAHNLIDAINSVHSAVLSSAMVEAAALQLKAYLGRYRQRLSHSNLVFVRELQSVLSGLSKMFEHKKGVTTDVIVGVNDFLFDISCDNVNMFQLVAKIKESRISNILRGFSSSAQASPAANQPNSFYSVTHFIECLTYRDGDGRILLRGSKSCVEFLLLSPEKCFEKLAAECKSVLLAGGTLSPVDWMARQLISDPAIMQRVSMHSFEHVVSPDRVLLLPLANGPLGNRLNFAFSSRGSEEMQNELVAVLSNVKRVSPGGVVVFFPSYAFQEQFFEFASSRLGCAIFRSTQQSGAAGSMAVFDEYVDEIKKRSGRAMLWSVVGGALSEGINFSDSLARTVVMVGVPYPNPNDVVIAERNKRFGGGTSFADALATRAVNQSIGRAIRHANDYACILLVDARYVAPSCISTPAWMNKSMTTHGTFGSALADMIKFFRRLEQL